MWRHRCSAAGRVRSGSSPTALLLDRIAARLFGSASGGEEESAPERTPSGTRAVQKGTQHLLPAELVSSPHEMVGARARLWHWLRRRLNKFFPSASASNDGGSKGPTSVRVAVVRRGAWIAAPQRQRNVARSASAVSAQRQRGVSLASAQRQRSISAASAQRQRSMSAAHAWHGGAARRPQSAVCLAFGWRDAW